MTREENITVPRWFLETVEDTLRIQNNINLDKSTGETCQDRNVKESLNGLRKLLRGEELTGGERLENLQPPLPSNLDEAAEETAKKYYCSCLEKHNETGICDGCENVKLSFKAGAEWMAGQGYVDTHAVINEYRDWGDGFANLELAIATNDDFFEDWQEPNEIIIQIRKKQ